MDEQMNELLLLYALLLAYEDLLRQVEMADIWSDIPMRLKASIIKQCVLLGITDLEQIRQWYAGLLLLLQELLEQLYLQVLPLEGLLLMRQLMQGLQMQLLILSLPLLMNGYATGGRVNRFDGGGLPLLAGRRYNALAVWGSSMPNITQGLSSILGLPTITLHDLDNRKTINAANELLRLQLLRALLQGTLSLSNFKGDGMTALLRNLTMYNPQGVGDVVKGAAMRTGIEYQNGNSVFNGVLTVALTAMAAGAGGAALGTAGKVGQVANGAMKAKKVVDATQGMAQSYQNGDKWGVASNALSLVGKAPVGKGVALAASVAGGTMKVMKKCNGGRIRRR